VNVTRDPEKFFNLGHLTPETKGLKFPSNFWIVKGEGQSDTSELNAFDNALLSCGIAGLNLIQYSSVIPFSSSFISDPITIPFGSQTGVILAKESGGKGVKISSGIAVGKSSEYYVVFENHKRSSVHEVEEELLIQVKEAVGMRGGSLEEIFIESVESDVTMEYGYNIVAIVFDPRLYK